MKILFIGQASFGGDVLNELCTQGEQIIGSITVSNKKMSQPIKKVTEELNIPLLETDNLNCTKVKKWVANLSPDLLVLSFVTMFVPNSIINMSTHGGINYHPSLLPKYRGGSAINWAIINGEKETGVTIHYIDEGIDTGDIILQENVKIDDNDTVVSLYFNKLYPLGIDLMKKTVKLIKDNKAHSIPQDNSKSSYQPIISEKDTVIPWDKSVNEIYNLIRGSDPTPGANTMLLNEKIYIWKAKPSKLIYTDLENGTVTRSKDGLGFSISAKDGTIDVEKLQFPDTGKISSEEAISSERIKVGQKLR